MARPHQARRRGRRSPPLGTLFRAARGRRPAEAARPLGIAWNDWLYRKTLHDEALGLVKQVFRSAFGRHTRVIRVVAALVDRRIINDRHGRFALRSAATLPLVGVYADRANGYDICDVRGKTCF